MLTVAALLVPELTRVGSVPKASLTFSPSSSTVSSVAMKVMLFSVSPLLKVRLLGTPEKSDALAPPSKVLAIGIVTVRSGSALSVTVMTVLAPSPTL